MKSARWSAGCVAMFEGLEWVEERPDIDGAFDELACMDVAVVHVERLDDDAVWIGIDGDSGRVVLRLSSASPIKIMLSYEPDND